MIIVRSILFMSQRSDYQKRQISIYPRVGKQGFSPSRRENGPLGPCLPHSHHHPESIILFTLDVIILRYNSQLDTIIIFMKITDLKAYLEKRYYANHRNT